MLNYRGRKAMAGAGNGRHPSTLPPPRRLRDNARADDQPFRLTSIAFAQPKTAWERTAIVDALRSAGADVTVNNFWILGWLGGYDKLAMVRHVMARAYGIDIDVEGDAIVYSGDSTNDAPMFAFFRYTVGVSTVRQYLAETLVPPSWITAGPGDDGFVEIADAVLGPGAKVE